MKVGWCQSCFIKVLCKTHNRSDVSQAFIIFSLPFSLASGSSHSEVKPLAQVTINSTLKRKFVCQFKQILVQGNFLKSVNIAMNWQGYPTRYSGHSVKLNHDPTHAFYFILFFFKNVFICPQCLLPLVTILKLLDVVMIIQGGKKYLNK